MLTRRLALSLALVWACGPEDYDHEDEPLIETSEEVGAALDCTERPADGYSRGSPLSISVVTVDGKPVEVDTANAFLVMRDAAARDGVSLRIGSGFRTMDQQRYLYGCYVNCNCNSCNQAARPGYSNHQSGHALDIVTLSGVTSWLRRRGGEFGFSETVAGEPWHWEWWGGGPGGGPCGGAPPPPPPPAPSGCGILGPGGVLSPGGELRSCSGRFSFAHQADGNVVLYGDGRALWSSRTNGRSTGVFAMQGDGNLVLYTPAGTAIWNSRTDGNAGAWLAVQDDGNVVIYSAWHDPLWATHTVQPARSPTPAPAPPPAPAPARNCGFLGEGASLAPDHAVRSCDDRFTFVHQGDGNVVLYDNTGRPLFHTGTHGRRTDTLVMQGDGNLVLYGPNGALWSSRTHGHSGATLSVQDDGNVVIYQGSRALWATHTER